MSKYDRIDFWVHSDGRCTTHCVSCGASLVNGERDKHDCPEEPQTDELGEDGRWRPSKPIGKPIRPSKARRWFRRLLRRLGWRK